MKMGIVQQFIDVIKLPFIMQRTSSDKSVKHALFDSLPDELLREIFNYTEYDPKYATVSRRWRCLYALMEEGAAHLALKKLGKDENSAYIKRCEEQTASRPMNFTSAFLLEMIQPHLFHFKVITKYQECSPLKFNWKLFEKDLYAYPFSKRFEILKNLPDLVAFSEMLFAAQPQFNQEELAPLCESPEVLWERIQGQDPIQAKVENYALAVMVQLRSWQERYRKILTHATVVKCNHAFRILQIPFEIFANHSLRELNVKMYSHYKGKDPRSNWPDIKCCKIQDQTRLIKL